MNRELLGAAGQGTAWIVALLWGFKTSEAMRGLPTVENLTGAAWDDPPATLPGLTVIVPARNEAAHIAATLDSLLQQEYPGLQVIAVNDRSTDATATLLDAYAAAHPTRLRVLHITELPDGWLGKTNAMETASRLATTGYILFTDADVRFAPSVLRRSIAFAEREQADHMVTVPTALTRTWGEATFLGFLIVFGAWTSRPWRVADVNAQFDVIGIGAFNLVRRDALEAIGGFAPQRLAVLEDIVLARRFKAAAMRQRVAFAPRMVEVHWAAGARGLMRVMSKNLFSGMNFHVSLALLLCLGVLTLCIAPIAGLAWWPSALPGLLVLACITLAYRTAATISGIPPRYAWTFPLGALLFCYAVLRSVVVVLWDGGVRWRDTLYPLKELRKWNSPLQWMRRTP